MSSLRTLVKIAAQILIVLGFFVVTFIAMIFVHGERARRKLHRRVVSICCRLSCKVMGIKINVINAPPREQSFLLVANHVGFMDIYMLSAIRSALFITSTDLKATPGLGQIAVMGGCLFVNRRNRSGIHKEIRGIREAIEQNNDVVLFPEAMSTCGDKIYPFKKTLLGAAAGTGHAVLPVVINFRKINGEPMSAKWRDFVCWYGDQAFGAAAWRAYSLSSIEVDIEFLQPLTCKVETDRNEVAARAQAMVESKYTPIPLA